MAEKTDRLTRVCATIGVIPNFPKPGVTFRDIFPVLRNPAVFQDLVELLNSAIEETVPDVQCIVGLESRGFLFGTIIAQHFKVPFVPVRKKGKLPGEVIAVTYKLEYGEDTFEVQKDSVSPGTKVVIIDDLLATGGTMKAACDLMAKLNADVRLCLVIIELNFLKGRDKLAKPVKAVVNFDD